VDRTACVNLPVFPVQLLLRRHPEWRKHPVAVVDSDRPQGAILWVNDRARSFRILPGMRYAAGLSLAGGLRAAVVSKEEIGDAVASLGEQLRSFSPRVEPARDEPGVFWVDASGLERLYGSLKAWARRIRSAMKGVGFLATVVVGFNRFGTYAIARAGQGVVVLQDPVEEGREALLVPLDRLGLEPATREVLEKLGIETVGQFIALPAEGIGKRFGPDARRLHRLASGELRLPLQPERVQPPPAGRVILDHTETDTARLLVMIEGLLKPVLQVLAGWGHALTEVEVRFRFERLGGHVEKVRPAAPTLDGRQVLELIRLRLDAAPTLPDGVAEVELVGRGVAAAPAQQRLLDSKPKRDLAAGNRALARVRAEFGEEAVVRARLRPGHLPEGSFTWEPLEALAAPRPRNVEGWRLIRRIYLRPIPLEPRPRQEPDGWMPLGLEEGPVASIGGPYVISGGWWVRPVHREYYFAETRRGALLWVYYDRPRRRWFLQGKVE
jgi:protein ImuB